MRLSQQTKINSISLRAFAFVVITFCAIVSSVSLVNGAEAVDRIVIVVGDEVILASEITSQIQMYTLQSGKQPQTEVEMQELQNTVVTQMVSEKLFLLAAKEDTTLTVRDEEVEAAVEEQVAKIIRSFKSEDEFMAALAAERITVRDLKKRYRTDLHNQMLKQRFIQRKLYSVSVSRHEVESFYAMFEDSIPSQPEAIRLSHILLPINPSDEVEDSVKQLTTDLRQQILDGADFATLATQYSSFGAGAQGGDLGYISRDDVVPEFARAAFILNVGDISGVIRTQFGFHIIKCEGKKEERVKLRHILLGVKPSATDTARTFALADSIITELGNGADFALLAKEFSIDNTSRAQGGELGWISTSEIPTEISSHVAGWTTPDEIRGPAQSNSGVHVFKLLEYSAEKSYGLENDFDRLKELARQEKTARIVDEWIADLKDKTYIDYRIDGYAN